MPVAASPLSWPAGWKRTTHRTQSQFGITRSGQRNQLLTIGDGLNRLFAELRRLGAASVTISTNARLNKDGWPSAGSPLPADPGCAVYFRRRDQDYVLACDHYTRLPDNMAAIAAHMEAMRAMERYGVGTLDQAFAGYKALPQVASAASWANVLGVPANATLEQVEHAYRSQIKVHHPDAGGGNLDTVYRLNTARDDARRALGAIK